MTIYLLLDFLIELNVMDSRNLEIEIKFQLTKTQLDELKDSNFFRDKLSFSFKKHNLTTYFDTARHDLRKRNCALRIRESEDKKTQTLKIGVQNDPSLQQSIEISGPVDSLVPNTEVFKSGSLPTALGLATLEADLLPIFKTSIERTQWEYKEGQTQIEVCIDTGEISSLRDSRTLEVSELELELVKGTTSILKDFSNVFIELFGLVPYHKTKADRGYSLIS